jgi:hypothetical protein
MVVPVAAGFFGSKFRGHFRRVAAAERDPNLSPASIRLDISGGGRPGALIGKRLRSKPKLRC